VCWFNW